MAAVHEREMKRVITQYEQTMNIMKKGYSNELEELKKEMVSDIIRHVLSCYVMLYE